MSDTVEGREAILDTYQECIEKLVGAAEFDDALNHLQDMVQDFDAARRSEVVLLRSRYTTLAKRERLQLPSPPEATNQIAHDILEITDRARATHTASAARSVSITSAGARPAQSLKESLNGATSTLSSLSGLSSSPTPRTNLSRLGVAQRSYWREELKRKPRFAFAAEDISKSFGAGSFRLNPMSVHLHPGQVTAVVGRNACGKTTLLKVAQGALASDTGQVKYPVLEERNAGWETIRSQIAFVPQLPSRWHGPVLNNLLFVASAYYPRRVVREEVQSRLQRYGLERYRNASWDELSGGFKIRFELVRALLANPRLLILDEPLAYLDEVARLKFLEDVRAAATSLQQPIAVLISSQHITEVEAVADDLIFLDEGQCRYYGSVDRIGEATKFCTLEIAGSIDEAELRECVKALDPQGLYRTCEGFLLLLPKSCDVQSTATLLISRFGNQVTGFQNLSLSSRSFLQEQPSSPAEEVQTWSTH